MKLFIGLAALALLAACENSQPEPIVNTDQETTETDCGTNEIKPTMDCK